MKRTTGVFVLLFAALVFGVSIFQVRSPDLYWHVKMGSDWLFKGLSPFVDHYSYTMPGKPIVWVAWGFQIVIALLYRAFGMAGTGVFRFIAFSLTLFLLNRAMTRAAVAGSLRVLGLAVCLVGFILHSEPRPEVMSLAFEALFVALFLEWRKQRTLRALILPLVLLVVWVNVHVTGVLGVMVALAFLGEAGLDDLLNRRYDRLVVYAACGAVFFAASLVNHELASPLPHLLRFDPRWTGIIEEFEVRAFADYELPLRLYWVLMVLSLPALFARRQWAGIVLLLVSGYQGVRMYKFTSHLLVLTTPFVAIGLQHYWDQVALKGGERAAKLFAAVVAVAAAAVTAFDGYWIYGRPILPLNMAIDARFFPVPLVQYMKDTGAHGRVFNHYDFGAYLFFNFDQDIKVFIDQRTNILYGIEVFDEWLRIATVPEEMRKGAEKYQFAYVVSRPDQSIVSEAAIESGIFGLEYVDNAGALFVRGRGRFPESARYLFSPRCIDEAAATKLLAEFAVAQASLPRDSILTQYLMLVNLYASATDKAGLFNTLYWASSSTVARLASELAYRTGRKDAALVYLNAIEFKTVDDQLMIARVLIELQQFDEAQAFLDAVSRARRLRDDQKVRAAAFLRASRDHQATVVDAAAHDHCEFLAKIY